MLEETTLFGDTNKVETAIERLKTFEPADGYYLAFSGGKDSSVIKHLAESAKVKFDSHYAVTTIDPPEVIYFIRQFHKDVVFDKPDLPMLHRLVKKGYPSRKVRWCCRYLKEKTGKARRVVTGIRWAESAKRKSRKMVEGSQQDRRKSFLHPIIDWSDSDVWEYLKKYAVPYCKLYDEGWTRIGCLFCPMASDRNRKMEAERYPRFVAVFRLFFNRLYSRLVEIGNSQMQYFENGDALFDWWLYHINDRYPDYDTDQLSLFDCM